MRSKVETFQNCASAVEDIPNPMTGEVEGRAFVIIDEDEHTVYRFPMPLDVAKQQGQRLMGIGGVQTASPAEVQALSRGNGGKKR